MAKLEELAKEIESIHDRTLELAPVAEHARDDSYDRGALLQELYDARLGFFAHKLEIGYYDQNAEGFAQHMAQLSADQQTEEIAKEALKDQSVDQVEEAVAESETVPSEQVGQNLGDENRPVTPLPADPSQPGQEVNNDNTEQTTPTSDEQVSPADETATNNGDVVPTIPAVSPQETTNDVPAAEQAAGGVEETAQTPPGMTTSETLQQPPDAGTFEITVQFDSRQSYETALNEFRDKSYSIK